MKPIIANAPESADLSAVWAPLFIRTPEELREEEERMERKAAGRRAQIAAHHARRKWDAVKRTAAAALIASSVYGFAAIGLCPDLLAAAMLVLLAGYAINMGAVIASEIRWYHRARARKQVRA